MRYDHNRLISLLCQVLEQLAYLFNLLTVQRRRWFIRQHNIRVGIQRSGNRHPLRLTSRQLTGELVDQIGNPQLLQQARQVFFVQVALTLNFINEFKLFFHF